MKKNIFSFPAALIFLLITNCLAAQIKTARTQAFSTSWKFLLGDDASASAETFNDAGWRTLNLPHDWSIELPFDSTSPTGNGGGALRGGLAWYRKTFTMPSSAKDKFIAITFDGIYRNSEVWINGHYLGKRPYGYSSFQYDLSSYIKYGNEKNIIAVKVDNSQQPNSRWYSGSGIYRNVWLTITNKLHIAYNGMYITTPDVNRKSATVNLNITIDKPSGPEQDIAASTTIFTKTGMAIAKKIIFFGRQS